MITVSLEVDLPDSFIDDVLTAAFEGGINYWCSKVIVVANDYCGAKYASEVISKGGKLEIVVDDGDDNERYTLTWDKFMNGLRKYAKNGGTLDLNRLDADDADTIVQYAIFDELVYS